MRNDFYLEALGNGGWGSLNYERKLRKSQLYGLRIGAGIIGVGNYGSDKMQTTIITAFSYLTQMEQKNLFLESSPGLAIAFNVPHEDEGPTLKTIYHTHYILTFTLGFRKYTKRNWLYRFTVDPGLIMNHGGQFKFIFGLSIGKRF